jgi:hypothetical protein
MPYYEVAEINELERICRDSFATDLAIKNILISNLSTGRGSRTTVFEADRHALYALCVGSQPLVLADIVRIITSTGIEAEDYVPPAGDRDYFKAFGRQAFLDMYPGRKAASDQEMEFYQTLAPYSPALVRIAKVRGEIREYAPSMREWQLAKAFSYAKVRVQ